MSVVDESGNPNGLDQLKPKAKIVNSDALDFIGKYKNDLNILVNAKKAIEQKLADENIDRDEINQKLSRINKSIVKLQSMIEEFEDKYEDELNKYKNNL